jgi:hypothetical protein
MEGVNPVSGAQNPGGERQGEQLMPSILNFANSSEEEEQTNAAGSFPHPAGK